MKRNKLFIFILMILCLTKLEIVHAENIYKEYKIGDKIMYNGMNFYVIENSDSTKDYVTLLKSEPLTADEVNKYGGVGTENNHVNMYVTSDTSKSYYQKSLYCNGGCMAYYTSLTCGYDLSGNLLEDGCQNNYLDSEVKYVVDNWSQSQLNDSDLIEDSLGYKTRLITYEELTNNLGYEKTNKSTIFPSTNGGTPEWVYDKNYRYWTMSAYGDSNSGVWQVSEGGYLYNLSVENDSFVRPVITLKKITENSSENIEIEKEEEDKDIKNEVTENNKKPNQIVIVPDTFLNRTVISVIVGIILIIIGIVIIYVIKTKKEIKLFFKKKDKK